MLRVFIGYDEREADAYAVCEYSLRRHASIPVEVVPVSHRTPPFSRKSHYVGNQRYDNLDGKPFSTDFAFARFLVPHLCGFKGWALFSDCDFLFKGDVAELEQHVRPDRAVSVVKHNYSPSFQMKMDGMVQTRYARKNWSSLILWNCGHPSNKALDAHSVNTKHGTWLHSFGWLSADEIGGLPLAWNWLEGEYPPLSRPKAIHYTNGGPWMKQWLNVEFASEWLAEKKLMDGHKAAAQSNVA